MNSFNIHGRLNILDVHRRINQKQEKKSVCYEKVLDICQKRIISLAEREKTCCMFEFPEYVIGYPLFDLNACMEYCKKSLVASGFWVDYYFPNKFYISWDFDEIKQKKNDAKKQIPLSALSTLAIPQAPKQLTQNPDVATQQTTQINIPPPHQLPPQIPYVPSVLQQKITSPLPLTPPKYNPYDVHIPPSNTEVSKPTNNTFFSKPPSELKSTIQNATHATNIKDMMGLLTSSIGNNNKNIFDYKPSGKLSLNI